MRVELAWRHPAAEYAITAEAQRPRMSSDTTQNRQTGDTLHHFKLIASHAVLIIEFGVK